MSEPTFISDIAIGIVLLNLYVMSPVVSDRPASCFLLSIHAKNISLILAPSSRYITKSKVPSGCVSLAIEYLIPAQKKSTVFVLSVGMGVPLLIIGAGANKLIPKPGFWMNFVNKIFGIILLGVAIYMLSRIISDSATYTLYALLFFGSGIYFIKEKNRFLYYLAGIFIIIAVGILYNKVFSTTSTPTLKYTYIKDVNSLNKEINSNNLVMVDFSAKWCASCKELDEITFANKDVINKLKTYKLLKIDVTNNTKNDKELLSKFNLFGPPALLFFKDGKLCKKVIGYISPQDFLKIRCLSK